WHFAGNWHGIAIGRRTLRSRVAAAPGPANCGKPGAASELRSTGERWGYGAQGPGLSSARACRRGVLAVAGADGNGQPEARKGSKVYRPIARAGCRRVAAALQLSFRACALKRRWYVVGAGHEFAPGSGVGSATG